MREPKSARAASCLTMEDQATMNRGGVMLFCTLEDLGRSGSNLRVGFRGGTTKLSLENFELRLVLGVPGGNDGD